MEIAQGEPPIVLEYIDVPVNKIERFQPETSEVSSLDGRLAEILCGVQVSKDLRLRWR